MPNAFSTVIIRMATRFENIVKPDNITFYVYVGICYRIPNAGLRRKVDDNIELIGCEKFLYKLLIGNISFDKTPF